MLELPAGLSRRALRAIADLEKRTVQVDGGRLKLEWGCSGQTDPGIVLRTATSADATEVSRLLADAFGAAPVGLDLSASESARTLLVEISGSVVGTVRITRHADGGGAYGFAIDPAWQGRGIGRDVLRRICHTLRDEGAHRVGLEVAVDNEHALGLYTSIGFTRVTTEDYYAIPCS